MTDPTHDNGAFDNSNVAREAWLAEQRQPDQVWSRDGIRVIEPATRWRRFVYRLLNPISNFQHDYCWAKGERVCAIYRNGVEEPVTPYILEDDV